MQKSKFRAKDQHPDLQTFDDIESVPIKNDQRNCTDILCIIIGVGLTVVLAILAIVLFNRPQYEKESFPADTDGNTCGFEYPGYNFLYFANPSQLGKRMCVKYCPTSQQNGLKCKKAAGMSCSFGSGVQYYQNVAVSNEYGMFCFPTDEKNRESLEEQMKSYSKDLYYNSVRTFQTSLIVMAISSIVYMLLVQCLPEVMNRVAVVVGIIVIIALAICFVLHPSRINSATRLAVLAITIIFLLIVLCTFVKNFKSWGLNGIFLRYATKFICARLYLLLLPFLFLGMLAAFFFFQALQFRSFWSNGQLSFEPEADLYHKMKNPTGNYLLTVLQIIQIIWGTVFLKESFNYLISAQAVEWYYGNPCKCLNGLFTLVCKHLGSVIAGSFMTAFFGIFDFLFDALIPEFDQDTDNPCMRCCNCFTGYFDLVRSDAMAFVYLTGNSFCNSSRYCEYIVKKSALTSSSQSSSRIYRLAAHFTVSGLICILSMFAFNKGVVSISAVVVLLFIGLGISTFFISIHTDAAEAILILLLTQEEFGRRETAKAIHRHGNYVSDKQQDLAKEVNEYQVEEVRKKEEKEKQREEKRRLKGEKNDTQ